MPTAARSILALTHAANEHPGLLETAARERGFTVASVRVDQESEALPDPGDFDAVFVMGADESVYDGRVGWIAPEVEFVRRAARLQVPVLGVCFGGQLLAHTLGGQVRAAEKEELGWLRLTTTAEELVAPGPWLAWHGDVFDVPPGARRIAWNDHCTHAFTSGPHLGLQFHPEVTPEQLRGWLDDADERGAGVGAQRHAVLAEAVAYAADSAQRAGALLDGFLRHAGLVGAEATG